MKTKYLLFGVQLLALVLFIIFTLGLVFSQGVCCGDDAYHAMVAKNLADGHGYASTLPLGQSHPTVLLFDPLLGTGPTIILPAALMIKLVGNTYWAPGITCVVLWSVLLLCIGIVLNKLIQNKLKLTVAIVVFFILAYLLTVYHFEQWYALFGEIPAALLIILGILIYFLPNSKRNLFIIGILFSLAFEAKMVALLPFASFVLFVILYQLLSNTHQLKLVGKQIIHQLFFIGIGFFIPLFLFEAYRLVSLHGDGYIKYWRQAYHYLREEGVKVDQGIFPKILARIGLAVNRFGIYLPVLFIVFAWIGYVLRKDKRIFAIFSAFVLNITIYTFYWLVLSIGWARYYVICLIIMAFTLTLPILSDLFKPKLAGVYALVLIALSIYNMNSLDTLFPFRNVQLFHPSNNTLALMELRDFLSSQIKLEPFLTQWWATAIDLEYSMDSALNFTTYNDPAVDYSKPYIIVVNNKFQGQNDDRLSDFEKQCNTRKIDRYTLIQCNPSASP